MAMNNLNSANPLGGAELNYSATSLCNASINDDFDVDLNIEIGNDADNVDDSLLQFENWLSIKAVSLYDYDVLVSLDHFNLSPDLCSVNLFGDCGDVISVQTIGGLYPLDSVGNYSVCSATSLRRRSPAMLVPVKLNKFLDDYLNSFISSHALLDSGAAVSLISEALVLASRIPFVEKRYPYDVSLADKSVTQSIRFETVPIWLSLGSHKERITFDIMPSLSYPLIIGLPWLEHHNPVVDWKSRRLDFKNCL